MSSMSSTLEASAARHGETTDLFNVKRAKMNAIFPEREDWELLWTLTVRLYGQS